jgi:hypothetical protein
MMPSNVHFACLLPPYIVPGNKLTLAMLLVMRWMHNATAIKFDDEGTWPCITEVDRRQM